MRTPQNIIFHVLLLLKFSRVAGRSTAPSQTLDVDEVFTPGGNVTALDETTETMHYVSSVLVGADGNLPGLEADVALHAETMMEDAEATMSISAPVTDTLSFWNDAPKTHNMCGCRRTYNSDGEITGCELVSWTSSCASPRCGGGWSCTCYC